MVVKKLKFMEYFGAWDEKFANSVKKVIYEERKRNRKRNIWIKN